MIARLESISQTRWVYLIALCLGFLLAVVFDSTSDNSPFWIDSSLFGIIALAGYLFIVRQLTPKRAIGFGYLFGLSFFGWGLNWIYISMAVFGGAPLAFAIAANGAVVAYLALYWLIGTYLIVKLGKSPNQRLLLAPAIIVLLEWIRSVFLIGFPWLSLGYGWIDSLLASAAERVGVFGVSFLLLLLIALVLLKATWWIRGIAVIATLIIFIPLNLTHSTLPPQSIKVSLIQGNMPVITEYNDQRMTQNLAQYHVLTEPVLTTEKPDVVIWPEAAIPYFYVESRDFLNDIFALQQTHQFDLITGVPHANWDTQDIYNSILLQKVSDKTPQFYNKSHLLPFGEYLPFRSVFAFFKDIVDIPMSDFARGSTEQPLFNAGGLNFSPSICFEAVFGNEIRQNAKHADVLLNVSNDAWFGKSKAQIQHLNIARMRAIENQKMLVRVTNNGRTAVINKDGKTTSTLTPFKADTLSTTIYKNNKKTLYSKIGDSLIIAISLLFIMFNLLLTFIHRQPHQ